MALATAWSPASAATYLVANDAELRQAILDANASSDPNSTITLTGSFALTNVTLPSPTKPIAIDTGSFTLSGAGHVNFSTTNGNALTLSGNFVAGDGTGVNSGYDGLWISNFATVSNVVNNGTITGGAGGPAGGAGGEGASLANTVFNNNGTVSGGTGFGINAGGSGIEVRRGTVLTNNVNGVIQGGAGVTFGGAGVDIGGPGATSTLINHGTIRGGNGLNGGSGTVGVFVRNGTNPIVNTGMIEGGTGASAIVTNSASTVLNITNSGTIRAGAGQANAIWWGTTVPTTGSLTLELQAGSVIEGNVVGNAAAGNDIFRLGGTTDATFDVSAIDVQYLNFNTLQKVGTGTWALTGAGTHTTPWEIVAGTLQIGSGGTSGSIVSGVINNATLAFNRSDTLTYGGLISGTGIVNQVGTGTTILTGANTYGGATNVYAGTLWINGDQSAAAGLTSVFAGARLGGTGIIGGDLTGVAGGVIAPGNSIGTMTVNGNYISNGATLEIEAELGGDSSPADLLLIQGDSLLGLAPTLVQVINVGGLGGATTEGIKIVDVAGGTSDAGVFVLNGPAIGGAYKYELFQNGIATPADGDWYLRNTGLLSPTTPTFENYPVALLGMIDLPTLRQRVGDRTEAARSIWTRIEGGAGHYEASDSSTGASYDSTLFLAQIGLDATLHQSSEGSLTAGLTAQYGRYTADVFSSFGDGSNFTESLGVGASLTWRGTDGTYLDLQGQLASFATDLDAVGYSLVEDNAGGGFAVSLEAGHRFDLDDNWSLTPQAQLSYASVDFDDFTDHFGSEISLEQGQSLLGRIGVAIDYATEAVDENGQASTSKVYGIANVTYEFLDGAAVVVSGTDLSYAGQKFGAELGLGGTLEWADGAQALHGELIGSSSLEGSYAVKGTLGFTGRF